MMFDTALFSNGCALKGFPVNKNKVWVRQKMDSMSKEKANLLDIYQKSVYYIRKISNFIFYMFSRKLDKVISNYQTFKM